MNQSIVSHTKCKKCGSIQNIADLVEWPAGFGMVCIDETAWRVNEAKSKRTPSNKSMEPALDSGQSPASGDA